MTTTTSTMTLPASNITIPASTYNITGLKTLNTMDGYAYTATLRQGTHPIAKLQQDGYGGNTSVYWNTPTYEAEFTAYVSTFEGKWGELVVEGGFDWDVESVIEALVSEVILARELARKSKTAILLLTPECPDPTDGYSMVKGTTAANPRLEEILAKYAPTATAVWHGDGWRKP